MPKGESVPVTMHDGSRIVLRKVDKDYDPTDRGSALARIRERLRAEEYLTGLLHISTKQPEFHELNATPEHAAQSDSLRQAQSRARRHWRRRWRAFVRAALALRRFAPAHANH